MSDLSRNLDASERAYAVEPTPANWKRIVEAKLAAEQETTRLAALSRIAADDAAAETEADKQKLRDELAVLSPTLNAPSFFAVVAAERKAVHDARLAIFRARIALNVHVTEYETRRARADELHKVLSSFAHDYEPMSVPKAEAMLVFDAFDMPQQSLLTGPTVLHECASILGVGQGAGLDAQVRARLDAKSVALSAIRDKLMGSHELAALKEADDATQKIASVAAAARVEAVRSVRGLPNNTLESLSALADAAAEHAVTAHNAENKESNLPMTIFASHLDPILMQTLTDDERYMLKSLSHNFGGITEEMLRGVVEDRPMGIGGPDAETRLSQLGDGGQARLLSLCPAAAHRLYACAARSNPSRWVALRDSSKHLQPNPALSQVKNSASKLADRVAASSPAPEKLTPDEEQIAARFGISHEEFLRQKREDGREDSGGSA